MIENEEKYDGYYAVATNLDDDAKSILAVSGQRYKIEDCFRVLKTNFESRPVNHRNRNRITAHFMICYTALLIYPACWRINWTSMEPTYQPDRYWIH